jgi:hypothetical protein
MKRVFFVAWLAAVPLATLFAQSGAPPAVLQITRESIKEGKGATHRKVEQEYVNAFRKNNFPYHYLALSSESGPNEVWLMDAFDSFAAMEEADRVGSQPPLKYDIEAVEVRDGELRTGSHSMSAVYRSDLSYLPANALTIAKTRYMMIATYRVRLGHEEDFTAGANAILGSYKKSMMETSVLAYEVIAGAPDGTYLFITPMATLKQLDNEPARQQAMINAMGTDSFRRLMKSTGDVFESMQSNLFSVSPEMSYMGKEIEAEDPGFWQQSAPTPAKSKGKADAIPK